MVAKRCSKRSPEKQTKRWKGKLFTENSSHDESVFAVVTPLNEGEFTPALRQDSGQREDETMTAPTTMQVSFKAFHFIV